MKKIVSLMACAALVGSMAFAADAENKAETTVDTSKNPITGTVKTVKKTKKKVKGAHGEGEVAVKEVTKVHKDGTVEKKVDAEGSSETKH